MLHLHRSERADALVDALSEVLAEPLADPLEAEIVCVPTRGVERWLTQCLALRLGTGADDDGVCANVTFPFPGRLLAQVAAQACGCPPGEDWWAPERTTWQLVELMDEHMGSAALAPLAAYLKASSPSGLDGAPRRFSVARRTAGLFDRYGVHRPGLLVEWLGATADQLDAELGQDAWQAHLWKMLRHRAQVPSPAERWEAAPGALRESPGLSDLPGRLCVFGLTRLPASYLEILRALAEHRDVHLWLLHPSPAMWDKVADAVGAGGVPMARAEDRSDRVVAHPLLRSWARDGREMQLVLAAQGLMGRGEGAHRPAPAPARGLLGLVQAALRSDTPPPGPAVAGREDSRPLLSPDDQSLVVHACHGRGRQVEVAREAVLHIMAEDPTLQPRDVIIMCPDIEAFAPLVQAAFGPLGPSSLGPNPLRPSRQATGPGTKGPGGESVEAKGGDAQGPDAQGGDANSADGREGVELRARLADRSLRQTNPLLAVAAQLLDLAGSRFTASAVLDLASQVPVARRFGFTQDDLALLQGWLSAAGVRWAPDAPYRRPWKLSRLPEGTWGQGLDRLALGVAMAGEGTDVYAGLLPYGDMGGSQVELVGRLCELVARLGSSLARLSGRRTARSWAEGLALSTLEVAASSPGQAWEGEQLHLELAQVVTDASTGQAGSDGPLLDLAEARALLAASLQGRPTTANFRTGDMTVCTLVPMRSVPHRVVCLVGLDDGVFPRPSGQDGDDLLGLAPQVGDPDVAGEDRQLLLDAVLAATQHLVITYQGHDQQLNQQLPPCAPVAELLDVVDQTVRLADSDQPARTRVVTQHPLQAFDPRNYSPGALTRTGPWRFDSVNLAGAKAWVGPRRPVAPFLSAPLAPPPGETVDLAALVRFLEHPVRAFLRERLSFFAPELPEPARDALAVELGPLERWALGERLLQAYLNQGRVDEALCAELGRGLLPPGPLQEPLLQQVVGIVQLLARQLSALACAGHSPASVALDLELPDGARLVGMVPGVRQSTVLRCTYSKTRARHRLRAWAHYLALTAARPEEPVSAATLSQAQGSRAQGPRTCLVELPPAEGTTAARRAWALGQLSQLVALYRLGLCEPLPLYCATSAAWAEARLSLSDPARAGRQEWGPSDVDERPAEGAEPEHVLVLGGVPDFNQLLEPVPGPGDPFAHDLAAGERSRFGRLALGLWEPLLRHERRREG